jgi:crotonobetainyl-CoA:carnitine CoA-transferase CaiB-like acyl-CoA transferase
MAQVLAGYKVLDFTHVLAGPIATNYLRLHGADVVKLESAQGDTMRNYGGDGPGNGMGPSFVSVNTGKRSIVLDLKNPAHKEVALRLVAWADVVVENFRAGVMDRLGLGYEACKAVKPDIVFCSISGFGQSGPLKGNPAIDQIIQSMSGLMTVSGEPDSPSMRVGFPAVDTFTGALAAMSIVMALLRRERGGEGQYIDVAMMDAAMVMMVSLAGPYLAAGIKPKKTGNLGYSKSPTASTFPTAEGEITIGATRQDQFEALCRAVGRADLIAQERFADKWKRQRNGAALRDEMVRALAARPALEWEELLNEAGVAAGAVRELPDALAHPHFAHRQLKMPSRLPGNQSTHILNTGFLFAQDPAGVDAPPPQLGEHTRDVLAEIGFTAEQIDEITKPAVSV